MCASGCQKLHNTLHPAGEEPVLPLRGVGRGETEPRGAGWVCQLPPWKEAIFLILVNSWCVIIGACLNFKLVSLVTRRGARQKVGQTVPSQGVPSLFPEPLWHFP